MRYFPVTPVNFPDFHYIFSGLSRHQAEICGKNPSVTSWLVISYHLGWLWISGKFLHQQLYILYDSKGQKGQKKTINTGKDSISPIQY